ncbi:MAG: prepilin-type N-terminal cleavage/methylation domain-containing protein [Burkholderiaceae bacterium]|nr:MAG: prepilin-type N-terminal cleavage/methylation domain-containing protein [Burkholderiaceae bacterium]
MTFATTPRRPLAQRPAHGFTLVELMVAMALGLLLLAALVALLVSTTTGRSELDKSSRQIENGRYALQVLTTDIKSAGFIGTTGVQSWDRAAPVACPATVADLAYDAAGTGQLPLAVQLLDPAAPPACLDHYQTGTGILLITRVSSQTTTTATAAAAETYVQVSTCKSDAAPYAVGSGAGGSFPLRQKDCTAVAPLRKAIQRIYYISSCNECGKDSVPTLKVAEYVNGVMTVAALADGIENMQFDMGIDMDNDGAPDCDVSNPDAPPATQTDVARCPQPAGAYDWTQMGVNRQNVMTVRVNLLARNTEPSGGWKDDRTYDLGLAGTVGPFNDAYKRHAYSGVARVINVSALRELP